MPCDEIAGVSVTIADFLRLTDALPAVESADSEHYTSFTVQGRTFGYLWPRTETVGLKQTLAEIYEAFRRQSDRPAGPDAGADATTESDA